MKNVILIDSLAIDADKKTAFLAMISGRNDGVVIRFYPKVDVEKTEGVKRYYLNSKAVNCDVSELKIGETNLDNYQIIWCSTLRKYDPCF
jgi:hypothetical protein